MFVHIFLSNNFYTILLWLYFCITITVYARNNTVIFGFKPSEIATHSLKEGCSNLHDGNSQYQIKKFQFKIKTEQEEKPKENGFFSKFAKYFIGQSDDQEENQQTQIFTPLEQPFETIFNCNCDDIYCERIKSSFEKVPGYFTRALDIYKPIKIQFNIFSFSQSEERKDSDALAITTPPPYLILKDSENGWPFSYPLTLIKQLNTNVEIQYVSDTEDYDIDIDINTDQMMDDKYFTSMLAHEILHGMGIFYLIQPLSNMLPNLGFSSEIVMPPIDTAEYENEDGVLKEIKTFLPPSVYEKNFINLEKFVNNNFNITNNNTTLITSDYYFFNESYYWAFKDLPMNMYVHQPLIEDYEKTQLEQFNQTLFNWRGYPIAEDFYKSAITENSIGFLTNEGDILRLQTYNNEYSGDFFHISTPYSCESKYKCSIEDNTDHHQLEYGPDFVMLSKYYIMDMTVEEKINTFAPNNQYGLLGDGIVHMLTTMGWTERNHTRNNKDYIVLMPEDLENLQIIEPVNSNNIEINIYKEQEIAKLVSGSNISIRYVSSKLIILSLILIIIFLM